MDLKAALEARPGWDYLNCSVAKKYDSYVEVHQLVLYIERVLCNAQWIKK